MPSPVAHTIAGGCVAALFSQRLPVVRSLPVLIAVLSAANLPDVDYLAVVRGPEALERFHRGVFHSIGFVATATLPLAWLLSRRLGFSRAWMLLAAAGLTHLLLDVIVAHGKAPIGFPFFWPFTAERFQSPVTIYPGIDRSNILSLQNLHELLAELAWALPTWPLIRQLLPRAPRDRSLAKPTRMS